MSNYYKTAVLLTCHNRRKKTISCLNSFYKSIIPKEYLFEIFLIDDGSTDGTSEAVKELFPQIFVIRSSGNLYWNQGMRLAWETASKSADFDFYLWLNDDVLLYEFSISHILNCYQEALNEDKKPSIITGACKTSEENEEFSYGGRTKSGPVIPNGKIQMCNYINGNLVLVPKTIFQQIGILSPDYRHNFGDFDYGLRTQFAGYKCYTTKIYVALCPNSKEMPAWCNPRTPFQERIKLWSHPKGPNLKEYYIFLKRSYGSIWIIYAIRTSVKAYFKIIFPGISS